MKKVAIIFWGLTRGLKHTIKNLEENLFSVLRENNIEYNNFIHTWYFEGLYENNWHKLKNIQLDFEEYKLLNAKISLVENQDEVIKNFDFKKYHTKGDCFKNNFQSHNYYILSLISQKRIIKELEKIKDEYDYVIFQRPDIIFDKKFDINWFKLANDNILFPSHGSRKKGYYNDRWCLANTNDAIKYGNVFDLLFEYSQKKIVCAEGFLGWVFDDYYKKNVVLIDFNHRRVDPEGKKNRLNHLNINLY